MTVGELKTIISADTSSLDAGLKRASSAMHQATGSIGGAGRLMGGVLKSAFSGVLGIVGSLVSGFASLAGGVLQAASAIGGAFLNACQAAFGYLTTAAKIAVIGLVGALVLLGRQGLAVNESLQTTSMGLTVLLKSAAAAGQFMKELRQEAITSAFEFLDLAGYSKKLLAMGFGVKEIIPTIRALGDAVSALGGGQEVMGRLILALGQMRAKGKVSAEEMMQLTEAGIPAWDMLAKAIGKTTAETMKLSEKGLIPSAVAINALVAGMQQRFGGLQKLSMNTWEGVKSTIKDISRDIYAGLTVRLHESRIKAGKEFAAFLSTLKDTRAGQVVLGTLERAFTSTGKALEGLVSRLPGLTVNLAQALQGDRFQRFQTFAANAFNGLRQAAGAVVNWFKAAWPALWETVQNITIGAVKVIGGGIAGLLAVYQEWAGSHVTIQDKVKSLADSFINFGVIALQTLGRVIVQTLRWGGLIIAIKAGVAAASLSGVPTAGIATFLATYYAIGRMWQGASKDITSAIGSMRKIDTAKLAADLTSGKAGGNLFGKGTFGNAYRSWGQSVDEWIADAMTPKSKTPESVSPSAPQRAQPWEQPAGIRTDFPLTPTAPAAPSRPSGFSRVPVPQFSDWAKANQWAAANNLPRHWNPELGGWVDDQTGQFMGQPQGDTAMLPTSNAGNNQFTINIQPAQTKEEFRQRWMQMYEQMARRLYPSPGY